MIPGLCSFYRPEEVRPSVMPLTNAAHGLIVNSVFSHTPPITAKVLKTSVQLSDCDLWLLINKFRTCELRD